MTLPKPRGGTSGGGRFATPFVKRIGGKRQLLPVILPRVPKRFRAYREPFVGGGALFWELIRQDRIERAFLSDACPHLINAYQAIRDDVEDLIVNLKELRNNAEDFYRLRDLFNAATRSSPQATMLSERRAELDPTERAVLFLYLNKTCFNGLWRVNGAGEFNASFAGYENPTICDPENLRACSADLQGQDIRCCDFADALRQAQEGDFCYLDCPYIPLTTTSNFTGYCADGFDMRDQVRLRDAAADARRRGVQVLLSNSSAPAVFELYRGWTIETVDANRAVNCKGDRRGPVKEVLIT